MIADKLDGGRLTAIDRSAKMVAAAVRRNAAAIEAGKAEFFVMSLETSTSGSGDSTSCFTRAREGGGPR